MRPSAKARLNAARIRSSSSGSLSFTSHSLDPRSARSFDQSRSSSSPQRCLHCSSLARTSVRTVEQSHLSAKRTLDQLGIPRRTFYRWYDRYLEGGPEALEDRPSAPSRVWNRIPAGIHDQIIELALEQSELSPRELAVRFTDGQRYFVSESTVYRLLKAHDLITSPAYVVIKAADQFHTKTTRPNEM